MIKETYKQIIFTDNVEKLKEELKNKNNNIFISSLDKETYDLDFEFRDMTAYVILGQFLGKYYSLEEDYHNIFLFVIDKVNSSKNTQCDCVYICIEDVDKILPDTEYSFCRLNFFNLLNSITNKQIYFIIDIKYKDYVFNQIEEYNKHINRLRSFGEIHNQVIFVDDIEKVKQNINTETVMFNELDGSKCKDTKSFYDEVTKEFKFPDYFGRNLDAFNDCMNDYDWESTSSFTVIFNYIKNIDNILIDDEREKTAIFDTLLNYVIMRTERVFILIDKIDKDYFLEQVEIGKKY